MVNLQGELDQYKNVMLFGEGNRRSKCDCWRLPASGDLSVEADRELIRGIQEEMLAAYLPAAASLHV